MLQILKITQIEKLVAIVAPIYKINFLEGKTKLFEIEIEMIPTVEAKVLIWYLFFHRYVMRIENTTTKK